MESIDRLGDVLRLISAVFTVVGQVIGEQNKAKCTVEKIISPHVLYISDRPHNQLAWNRKLRHCNCNMTIKNFNDEIQYNQFYVNVKKCGSIYS